MVKTKSWKALTYAKWKLTDDDIYGLKLHQERKTYTEVDFSCNKLTSRGLELVAKFCCQCPELRIFKAFKNEIDDEGAQHIATMLKRCGCLEEIHLSHNQLTATGVKTIVRAADWNRVGMSPLWLRLEQNYVTSPVELLKALADQFSVCGRNDDWRCTSRHCFWKRHIHVPFLHLQRQDAWAEGEWEDEWEEEEWQEEEWEEEWDSWQGKSKRVEEVKDVKPKEWQPPEEKSKVPDAKTRKELRWSVKAENPVTEWARGVSEVWAPDAPAPVEKEKTKANKAPKEVKEPAKEPAKEPVKVEKKTAKVPKEKEEPKSEAKWIEKGGKTQTPSPKVAPAPQPALVPVPVGLQKEAPQEAPKEAPKEVLAKAPKKAPKSKAVEGAAQLAPQVPLLPPPWHPLVPPMPKVSLQASELASSTEERMAAVEDEKQAKTFLKALNAIIKEDLEPERQCRAELFGSMSTGFGTKGCDLDVVILSQDSPETEAAAEILMKLRKILNGKEGFEIKNIILSARVPILKLEYGGRDVDISVNNEKALKNSRLLAAYAQLDPLIAQFGVAVKLWAKDAQVCGAKDGHLSSYAFILMALYFLQVGSGDEMPCLQQGQHEVLEEERLAKRVEEVKASWKMRTGDLWTLLAGFFAFYAGSYGPSFHCHPFQWGEEVVSVRLGQMSRHLSCNHATEFQELKGRQEGHLHIEDPVERSRNLRDVVRLHPENHEQQLLNEIRKMDDLCRQQARQLILLEAHQMPQMPQPMMMPWPEGLPPVYLPSMGFKGGRGPRPLRKR